MNDKKIPDSAPAGGECQHEWEPDADVMNARYCPKCDVTQTIPRKSTKTVAPAGPSLYEKLRAEIDGGSESMTHEDALQWVRDARMSAPAGSGEVPDELRRIIHELRTYNPPADPYNGAHIHGVWARELDALLRKLQQGAE